MAKEKRYWDGVQRVYIPPEHLDISPKVKLSTKCTKEKDIDIITYEIVRHALFRANYDMGITITNLCVSPISQITRDIQPTLFAEDGEVVYAGQYMQFMSEGVALAIKWTLENRGDNPGINDGDVFLQNDPWIGVAHQQDVSIYAPVFVGDEIFCWVGTGIHQNDIGGTVPGSFCMNATDIWMDPQPIPPIKMVKAGVMDRQLYELYTRMSRTPVHLGLDLKAAVAGINVQKARLQDLIDVYGVDLVKGVMRAIISRAELEFVRILETIPDGTWRQQYLFQGATSGDRKAHRYFVSMRKEGTELYLSNEGSDPQAGAINLTYGNWAGGVLAEANTMIIPEHMGAQGGAGRHIHFEPISGKLICPDFGAAVSPSGTTQTLANTSCSKALFGKMLLCSRDEEVRRKVMTPGGASWSTFFGTGVNAGGEFYAAPIAIDNQIGCSGATIFRDGEHGGGIDFIPEGPAANSEENERSYPILTIYRKEEPYSSPVGKFCGGGRGIVLMTPHDGSMVPVFCVDEEVTDGPGLFGFPGTRHCDIIITDTNLKEMLEKGQIPESIDEIKGERMATVTREVIAGLRCLDLGDLNGVIHWSMLSSSGMFDPLARDPTLAQKDVVKGRYSREMAEQDFGVVLKDDLSVDEKETGSRREKMRKERLARATKWRE